ncbi:hypothetical protein [Burkholderia thailandensis]|uniref:hypothetical protein n=1 Tax=Burkholderia thailandensis TaxID=57975 RepID=UPI003F908E96
MDQPLLRFNPEMTGKTRPSETTEPPPEPASVPNEPEQSFCKIYVGRHKHAIGDL